MTEPVQGELIQGELIQREEASGHERVDAAVARLAEVASLAPREQVTAYEAAHRELQATLGTIEER